MDEPKLSMRQKAESSRQEDERKFGLLTGFLKKYVDQSVTSLTKENEELAKINQELVQENARLREAVNSYECEAENGYD